MYIFEYYDFQKSRRDMINIENDKILINVTLTFPFDVSRIKCHRLLDDFKKIDPELLVSERFPSHWTDDPRFLIYRMISFFSVMYLLLDPSFIHDHDP